MTLELSFTSELSIKSDADAADETLLAAELAAALLGSRAL